MFRNTVFLLILFLLSTAFYVQAQSVTVSGFVQSPMAYMEGGKFHQTPIIFYLDDVLYERIPHIAIPSESGHFTVNIPLKKATPARLEYDTNSSRIFLKPGQELKIYFTNNEFESTLRFDGTNASDNNYFAEYNRKFDDLMWEHDLDARKRSGKEVYNNYCQQIRSEQETFYRAYTSRNTTSAEFKKWAEAAIKYQEATNMSLLYYRSQDRMNDGYKSFASRYNKYDTQALIAREYVSFLENHIRQTCLRDDPSTRAARETRREHWGIRGFQVARDQFSGKVRDYMMANILSILIEAEYMGTDKVFNDFNRLCGDAEVRSVMGQRYGKLKRAFDKQPPSDAKLEVVKDGSAVYLNHILDKYKGKVVYIDFWASWCKPCLAEMSYSSKLHNQYKGKDVVFVYLSSDATEGPWRANVAKYQLSGDHYLMSKELQIDTEAQLNISGIPRYVLVNKEGEVVYKNARRPSDETLPQQIDRLLAQ